MYVTEGRDCLVMRTVYHRVHETGGRLGATFIFPVGFTVCGTRFWQRTGFCSGVALCTARVTGCHTLSLRPEEDAFACESAQFPCLSFCNPEPGGLCGRDNVLVLVQN